MRCFGRRPGLGRRGGPGAPPAGRRAAVVAAAAGRKPKAAAPPAADPAASKARLSRLLQQYGGEGAVVEQQQELEIFLEARAEAAGDPASARRAQRQQAGRFARQSAEQQAKLDSMFRLEAGGRMREANVGFHGGGRRRWWALSVLPGREKQVCDFLGRAQEQLPQLVDWATGEEVERRLEAWAPVKKVNAWNPK
jgi:hypothetical protein